VDGVGEGILLVEALAHACTFGNAGRIFELRWNILLLLVFVILSRGRGCILLLGAES
jgi:hypothetical protein